MFGGRYFVFDTSDTTRVVKESLQWLEAARQGDLQLMERLILQEPNLISVETPFGGNALHEAAENGRENVVAHLLANSKLITTANSVGRTALHKAAGSGHEGVVAQLLAANPTIINVVSGTRETALHEAARGGHEGVVAQLIAAAPSLLTATDTLRMTALHEAARNGHDKVVVQLLAADPKLINAIDYRHWTALDSAISKGHEVIADRLLTMQPDRACVVDRRLAQTPLHLACESGFSKEFLSRLWRLNPEALCVVNASGRTPFDVAISNDNNSAIELFQWGLSFDEIASAFAKAEQKKNGVQARYLLVMQQQCDSLLVLNKDVLGIVLKYLGFV